MPRRPIRRPPALLLVLLAAFAFLAVNGSLLLPLWEVPDENEHLDVVQHWAREGRMPDLTQLPTLGMNEGIQPPLAYWVLALGYRGLGLTDTEFLARQRHDAVGPDRALFLHGPDEEFPFAGPTRSLHLLRLVSVLWGLATVAGAWALARRLVPARPAVALGAAALVAAQPVFTLLCGGINNDPAAIALCSWSLVALADLATCEKPTSRRLLATGLLIGAAHLAKLSALFLLPLVPMALLLRRRPGEPLREALGYLDRIVAGFLVLAGWYFAWNLATYGDLFGWSYLTRKFVGTRGIPVLQAVFAHFLPIFGWSWCGRLSMWVYAGWPVLAGWSVAVAGGVAGLLARRAWRPPAERRVALLLALGVAINFASCLKYYLDFNQPQGRYLFPSLAAGAALLALGWSWLPRGLGAAGALALLAASFHAQYATLGPAFHPLNRAGDECLLAWDPLALVPEDERAPTVTILAPQDGRLLDAAPELRWAVGPGDPDRYTVHLGAPGLALRWRTWEVEGRPVRDRFRIPTELWNSLPPGVELVAQVLSLPTLEQALAAWPGGPAISVSPRLHLQRR